MFVSKVRIQFGRLLERLGWNENVIEEAHRHYEPERSTAFTFTVNTVKINA